VTIAERKNFIMGEETSRKFSKHPCGVFFFSEEKGVLLLSLHIRK
jgi:hypothetical protein